MSGAEGDPEEPVDGGDACADRGEPGLSGGQASWRKCRRAMAARGWAAGAGGRCCRGGRGRAVDAAMLEAARVAEVPKFSRVVVAVDPPVTGMKSSDECGIVVVGADTRGRRRTGGRWCWRMPRSIGGARPEAGRGRRWRRWTGMGPTGWWPRSTRAAIWWSGGADQIDPLVPIRRVHAARGKIGCGPSRWRRLYEQGRVAHVRGLGRWRSRCAR
jgi:phage terminase large subunit-like protein